MTDDRDIDRTESELTSVADADWLAVLRAQAGDSKRSMAEVLADDPHSPAGATAPPSTVSSDSTSDDPAIAPDDDDIHDDFDDEMTITHPGGLDAIRAAVAEQRATASPGHEIDDERLDAPIAAASTPPSLTAPVEPAPAPSTHPPSPAPPASPAPSQPLTPPPSPTPSNPGPVAQPAGKPAQAVRSAAGHAEQRWVAPPRLAATDAARHQPLSFDQPTRRGIGWPGYAAIAVALVLGFGAALLIMGRNDSENVPPDSTLVTDSEGAAP